MNGKGRPREGWEEAFRSMAECGDDRLLDEPVATDWDREQWEWQAGTSSLPAEHHGRTVMIRNPFGPKPRPSLKPSLHPRRRPRKQSEKRSHDHGTNYPV